ncbi:MAG: hypothetical protein WBF90_09565 [Rivularia sp. (in: cyanobacteria)]|jgi:hypothetical protein
MAQEIQLQRHNITHKIIVRCQHRYALYQQQRTDSFKTPSNGEPVLLNGMKVIFDKSAPVYPVSLANKD